MMDVLVVAKPFLGDSRQHLVHRCVAPMSRDPAKPEAPPDDVLGWLLAGDPAVVWQAQRDLMGLPMGTWSKTRRRVTREGWGEALLGHRSEDGTWGGGLYSPKWTSTFYSLQLLTILGGGGHPDAVASGRLLLDRGVCDDGAVRLWVTQYPDTCVAGMLLTIACAVGLGADSACEAMADSLLREQMDDGGWNCARRRGAVHGSFDTTLSVLEGLAAWAASTPCGHESGPQGTRAASSCSPTASTVRTAPERWSTRR